MQRKVINLLEDRNWIKSFNEFDKNGISLLPIDISEIIFNSENILDDNLNTKTSSNIINILSSSDWNEYGKNFRIFSFF